ncbi:MAG: RNA-directed DNA polymerase [bacterium]|nr:RNA-directed DNA polymerase [bacterium]
MSQDSDKAELIKSWWDKIEQESIRKSLDYRYVFMTDISNCYGSIYTHSLEWVFHKGGRNGVKKDRSNGKPVYNLGTKIDQRLRNMNQGQTIGIPQGSTLMDLIAEMVLGGVDLELDQTIKNELKGFTDFSILRYRDDYRIFTNDFQKGHEVMRILNNALYGWGMKMNTVKTFKSDDLILSSIKTEKVEQIVSAPIRQYYQKEALRIYSLSQKHPNSGLVATELSKFYDRIDKSRHLKHFDHEVIASIITMIAYFSPKYIPQVSAIVSKIIEKSKEPSFGKSLTKRIFKKFEDLPNTGLIDIWLQRIAAPSKIRLELKSELTQVAIAKKDNSMIWNSDWLDGKSKSTIDKVPISNLEALVESGDISPVIERQEFQLFRRDYF